MHRNYYQQIDSFPMFRQVTKSCAQVLSGEQLPHLLRQAVRESVSGKPGPAYLELAGHTGELVEDCIIDMPDIVQERIGTPYRRAVPDAASVAQAAEVLRNARRPVIVAGGGARASGAGPELVALAEHLRIPIATSLNGKAIVPSGHPLSIGVPGLYARQSANEVLLEADVVFFVGSQTGSQVTLTWTVPPLETTVVQLDIDAAELGKHYPNCISLLGDAKSGLQALLSAVAGVDSTARQQWVDRTQQLGGNWHRAIGQRYRSDDTPIRPERLCNELSQHLPENSLLLSDTGHSGMWTAGFVDLARGQDFVRAAGSLGWGLPAALGAQLSDLSRPTVLFTGDGGLLYHAAELETAARWNIPVVIVVNNNVSLNQEIITYTSAYGGRLHGKHGDLWKFRDSDLAAMAESMGARGLTVRRPTQFRQALEQAIETDGPVLIDVRTDIASLAPRGKAAVAAG
jgi:acetolactate synthase-1/2/3 large subunit